MRMWMILLLGGLACAASSAEMVVVPPYGGIDSEALLRHIRWLADDAQLGRGTGTPANRRAAEYIAEQLAAVGCEPAGDVDGWYQEFSTYPVNQLDEDAAKLLWVGSEVRPALGKDWIPMPFSALGDATGPVAFTGYGIQTAGYDDYDGFDASGKILLMLRYEPPANEQFKALDKRTPSIHAAFASKVKLADEQGAEAVLIVDPPSRADPHGRLYPFDPTLTRALYELPILHVSEEFADRLLAAGGLPSVAELEQGLNADRRPRSADLNAVQLEIKQGIFRSGIKTRNVLGLLRSTGSSESTLVIGGHYDHLGWRISSTSRQPEIHNGADDNASGIAGLLEVARILSEQPERDRHVLFIGFGAEEMGLIGSRHFVNHPLVPLNRIRVMINLDMIGRLYHRPIKVSYDTKDRALRRALRSVERRLGIKLKRTDEFTQRTDHAPFAKEGIPTLFAYSGLHSDYHEPGDDWERIDPVGTAQIVSLVAEVAAELCVVIPDQAR
jgi:hypothetical protein